MSNKKNYRKMYPAEKEQIVPAEEPVVEVESNSEETLVKKPKMVKGTIVDCVKLNVREQMFLGATVLCVLPVGSTVQVFANEKHDEWHHVITASGVEGFCMKQFIKL